MFVRISSSNIDTPSVERISLALSALLALAIRPESEKSDPQHRVPAQPETHRRPAAPAQSNRTVPVPDRQLHGSYQRFRDRRDAIGRDQDRAHADHLHLSMHVLRSGVLPSELIRLHAARCTRRRSIPVRQPRFRCTTRDDVDLPRDLLFVPRVQDQSRQRCTVASTHPRPLQGQAQRAAVQVQLPVEPLRSHRAGAQAQQRHHQSSDQSADFGRHRRAVPQHVQSSRVVMPVASVTFYR